MHAHLCLCVCVCVCVCVFSQQWYSSSVFLQREHQKKLEQTVEEMKQKETTAAKKQQELMARLSLNGYVGGRLRKGEDRTYFQVIG